MTNPTPDFAAAVADGVKILSLGKALSPARPGLLAQRKDDGFVVGELRAGPIDADGVREIAQADAAGRTDADTFPSEATSLLAAVFSARSDAAAVVLLRAPRLAAWGLSGRALPVRYFQMFGYTKANEIPVARATADDVSAALASHGDAPALLLGDGRVLIWGANAARAIRLVLSLEEAAHVTALADRLGGAKDYPATAREKIYASLQAQARQ